MTCRIFVPRRTFDANARAAAVFIDEFDARLPPTPAAMHELFLSKPPRRRPELEATRSVDTSDRHFLVMREGP